MLTTQIDDLRAHAPAAVIVGAGPIGVGVALALRRAGLTVGLIETGGAARSAAAQALSDHAVVDPATHHPAMTTVARRLGGASTLWGGRCLPYDPVDFEDRPWMGAGGWPIGMQALTPYLAQACELLDVAAPVFVDPPADVAAPADAAAGDGAFRLDQLERWSQRHQTQTLHGAALRDDAGLCVLTGATVVGLDLGPAGDGEAVTGLRLCGADGARATLPARRVVLAAGGNESTRLLLAAQRDAPARFGGADGPLGRHYMGHINGAIVDFSPAGPALDRALDFYVDSHGGYVRRRLTPTADTQRALALPNVAFWPVVPDVAQAEHGSGPLSLAWLALSIGPLGRALVAEPIRVKHVGEGPRRYGAHLLNLLRDPLRTAGFAPAFLWGRYGARHRLPGFFLRNRARLYGLEHHAEQTPDPDSRLTLSDRVDASGLPLLRIDYRVRRDDAEGVLRAVDALGAWLARTGLATLRHRFAPAERVDAIVAEARHGNHQIGTIRMGARDGDGVVDGHGEAFGARNLFVASTAVLRTSGQANPTLTAMALGLRTADRLIDRIATEEAA